MLMGVSLVFSAHASVSSSFPLDGSVQSFTKVQGSKRVAVLSTKGWAVHV